ncbi:MAG: UDP-3-O-acyl-N-acetylglucosamine deacetylase [Nitrospirota bacterium]|nr:UDP-3-O-acyl-N-acetylglucosamine deacetylase [Nitrospirota bacterium]MDP2384382.1 UDP-3-O-acyl-N-acetylglucosamine deacetylase [Nitrospirota bacterium]MDP3595486.1 UDP-3-O-acyl-N-acetylglucosamine deacetylase [Nitrospirota bacterium]
MRVQQTLANTVSCSGVGLHSGQPVTLTLRPAPADTGVVFVNRSGKGGASLAASVEHLVATELCTAISGNGFQVKTIEHILAALTGLDIDNVYVEVDAAEAPVMDGSAGPFVRLIRSAGIATQSQRQPYLKITRPLEVVDGNRRVRIEPSSTTKITYSIHYNHPLIQTQTYAYEHSVHAFEREIADARTFGFLQEVEALWARGLGKGGSLDNTIILSQDGILNESGLRFTNEFVRHKILDLIGDFSLLGVPFIGHVIAERSGHAIHTRLVQQILNHPDSWVLLNAEQPVAASEPRSAMAAPRFASLVALQAS